MTNYDLGVPRRPVVRIIGGGAAGRAHVEGAGAALVVALLRTDAMDAFKCAAQKPGDHKGRPRSPPHHRFSQCSDPFSVNRSGFPPTAIRLASHHPRTLMS